MKGRQGLAQQWKEYFEELLNLQSENSGEASSISLAEVSLVVQKLLSGKAPGG